MPDEWYLKPFSLELPLRARSATVDGTPSRRRLRASSTSAVFQALIAIRKANPGKYKVLTLKPFWPRLAELVLVPFAKLHADVSAVVRVPSETETGNPRTRSGSSLLGVELLHWLCDTDFECSSQLSDFLAALPRAKGLSPPGPTGRSESPRHASLESVGTPSRAQASDSNEREGLGESAGDLLAKARREQARSYLSCSPKVNRWTFQFGGSMAVSHAPVSPDSPDEPRRRSSIFASLGCVGTPPPKQPLLKTTPTQTTNIANNTIQNTGNENDSSESSEPNEREPNAPSTSVLGKRLRQEKERPPPLGVSRFTIQAGKLVKCEAGRRGGSRLLHHFDNVVHE